MPISVGFRLEKIQREFLWGGGSLEKKPHLVNWIIVCTTKKKGVLACVDFPISTRHCFVNGVGDSPMKGTLFGERSLAVSLVRAHGVGVLAISGEALM